MGNYCSQQILVWECNFVWNKSEEEFKIHDRLDLPAEILEVTSILFSGYFYHFINIFSKALAMFLKYQKTAKNFQISDLSSLKTKGHFDRKKTLQVFIFTNNTRLENKELASHQKLPLYSDFCIICYCRQSVGQESKNEVAEYSY